MDFETFVLPRHRAASLIVRELTLIRSDYYRARGAAYNWGIGTALSTAIMSIAFAFIVVEWCTQSHLSTENYDDAMQGLRRTRRFRKYTAWLRGLPNLIIRLTKRWWFMMLARRTQGPRGRRSLVWTWQTNLEAEMVPVIEGETPQDEQYETTHTHIELREALTENLLPRAPDIADFVAKQYPVGPDPAYRRAF
jgi:hypothetical protein